MESLTEEIPPCREELFQAAELCHKKGAKLYLTCNTVPRNDELSRLPAFLEFAQEAGVDAFILTDLGVFDMAKRYAPKVERHISTQAGVANLAAARMFYEMGASRVVLARLFHTPKLVRDVSPERSLISLISFQPTQSFLRPVNPERGETSRSPT